MLLVEFCILLYVMLLCEIMHHSIETIACQPSGLSRECNISTVLHFDFYPTPWRKRHCYNPHYFGPIVYLEDLHKQIFIVINCFIAEKMLQSEVKLLGHIFSRQNKQIKAGRKLSMTYIWWQITEIMRNTDPKKFTSDSICYEHLFLSWRRHCSYNFSFIPAIPSCVTFTLQQLLLFVCFNSLQWVPLMLVRIKKTYFWSDKS